MDDGNSIFITGARGFIGRHLLRLIDSKRYAHIYCTSRAEPDPGDRFKIDNLHWIRANIERPELYGTLLQSCRTVVHMAAATGKARPQDYFQVNSYGTQALIDECRRRGVTQFLYVSSIAAKFADKSRYYYAQSKEQAETVVRESGLNYTIVRPTIVLGKESPVWKKLSQLAKAPVMLLLGEGNINIQPIYVDDLAGVIWFLMSQESFENATWEIGGPEVLTLEDFLRRAHFRYRRSNAPVLHLPLKYVVPTVAIVERYIPWLPFNAGQLCAFINDGTAEASSRLQSTAFNMKNVDAMLSQLIDQP